MSIFIDTYDLPWRTVPAADLCPGDEIALGDNSAELIAVNHDPGSHRVELRWNGAGVLVSYDAPFTVLGSLDD